MSSPIMATEVTLISSLPPIVGLSFYTKPLVIELSKLLKVNFLGFRHIYPSWLYPGKMLDENELPPKEHNQLSIRNVLNWYNPIGWVIEAFKISTPIVHAQWWSFPLAPIYFVLLFISKLRKKTIIITVHNVKPHERSPLKVFLNKSIFGLGDAFIVHTQFNKEELSKFVSSKKIYIIPHGIPKSSQSGISLEDARSKLKLNMNDKILLCFGHIRAYKGVDTAIKSLQHIDDPSVKLLIAGNCWEDWEKYQQLINQLQLQNRVILKIEYIPAELKEAIFKSTNLVLLPYKHFDAQSGVGSLVLSYDVPMIVSKIGGLPDYVNDANCLIEPDDEKDLASKVKIILSDKSLYEKLQNDIEHIKEQLYWDKIAQQTINVYQSVYQQKTM